MKESIVCFDCGSDLSDSHAWEPFIFSIDGIEKIHVAVCTACIDEIETVLLCETVSLLLGHELPEPDAEVSECLTLQ